MKKLFIFIGMFILAGLSTVQAQTMSNYCSAPPYVSRDVVPNIMILMDNSTDMLNPAYSGAYTPNGTKDNYPGYFNPQGCYTYSSNKFKEELKTDATDCPVTPCKSYAYTDTCSAAAPYRGNLMNWATMSKYDLLQYVLLGGNTASKQGNAHTLVNISGSWSKDYSDCTFDVSSGNLVISEVVADTCALLSGTPIALREPAPGTPLLARLLAGFEKFTAEVNAAAELLVASARRLWDRIEIVKKAYAAQGLSITPEASWDGTVGVLYSFTLRGSGCNNCTYNWTFTPTPPASWFNSGEVLGDGVGDEDGVCDTGEDCNPSYSTQANRVNNRVTWTGVPDAPGDYAFQVTVSNGSDSKTENYTIHIASAGLTISTASIADAEKQTAYSFTMTGVGGVTPYTWSATGLPPTLTINPSTGEITGTPGGGEVGTYSVTITLVDDVGTTVQRTYTFNVISRDRPSEQSFTLKVELVEESLVDMNGNDIHDGDVLGETFTDTNMNGKWDGKQGIFQQFWDVNRPRARWGMTKFKKQGNDTIVDIDACIPYSPISSFLTRIQNATATDDSPLSKGLYGIINYFGFSSTGATFTYDGNAYSGCNNSDPVDTVTCRKNFVLVLSSGANVTGANFTEAGCTVPNNNATEPLVQNACFAQSNDLRVECTSPDNPAGCRDNDQLLYTYVVNTMGTTNSAILEDAAIAGGGKYYDASDTSNLRDQLIAAIQDILAQAASGTAVSVLTTSSRGVGSVVQAYFLPSTQEDTRDIWWTGYLKNIWIDPFDDLREDTYHDLKLNLNSATSGEGDRVMKIFFNSSSHETEAALFTTDGDGNSGTLGSCTSPVVVPFQQAQHLWEAGSKLADILPGDRNIYTANKVYRTTGTTSGVSWSTPAFTFTNNEFNTSMDQTLLDALDKDAVAPFNDTSNIIKYIRGWCLETTNHDTDGTCDSGSNPDLDTNYRDRRLNGKVWKLGDIISSTPKVLATAPQNTYHIDYSDLSYHSYISSTTYKQRSAVTFVGGNDGMLHAFRVGHLKDEGSGITGDVKALFKNFFSSGDGDTGELGKEIWAYVPFNAFPYLKYFGNTAYCHIYYADLSVRLVDASIGGNAGDARPSDGTTWRTILIGGMRFGGACSGADAMPGPPDVRDSLNAPIDVGFSSYFAIDVTNVGTTTTPENEITILWEFSDEDMGFSSSYPALVRTGPESNNGNWYVALGSGTKVMPKSGIDIHRDTNGYVYLIDLKTGALVRKVDIGNKGTIGGILSIDADKDYYSEKLYFGTSYCTDFNPSGFCNVPYNGKLMSIAIPNDNPISGTSTLTVEELFDGTYPFTAAPDAAKDENGDVWVYAGSGKYYSDMDEEDDSQQIFIGFNDTDTTGAVSLGSATESDICPSSCPATGNELCNTTNCSTAGTQPETIQSCLYDPSSNAFGLQTVVTEVQGTENTLKSDFGWVIFLPDREKMISRPLAVGGLVDFLTYEPTGDPCSYGGFSYLYALGYKTGLAPLSVAIRSPGNTQDQSSVGNNLQDEASARNYTSHTAGDVHVNKGVLLGPGAPPIDEAIILPPAKEEKKTLVKKIQIATGVIVETENNPQIEVNPKIINWLKK